MREHHPLQRGHAAHVLGALKAQDVRMPADRPRRCTGRVEDDRVEGPPRRPGRCIGLDHLGGQLQPREVIAQAIETGMLAAQAQIENIPLVTADPAFRAFDVRVLW